MNLVSYWFVSVGVQTHNLYSQRPVRAIPESATPPSNLKLASDLYIHIHMCVYSGYYPNYMPTVVTDTIKSHVKVPWHAATIPDKYTPEWMGSNK